MKQLYKFGFLMSLVSLFFFPLKAMSTPTILTSIKPIGLIAKEIAGTKAKVEVLLPDNASPHSYSLSPSELVAINNAEVLIWAGPDVETFLIKLFAEKKNALQLSSISDIDLIHYNEEASDHDHDHDHSGVNAHIWLGPDQSISIAKAIQKSLVELMPENKAYFQQNYLKFTDNIQALKQTIAKKMEKRGKYFLFHDAYGYFEENFGLKASGHISINPERRPGAKKVFQIKKYMLENNVDCIFIEPQYNTSIVDKLIAGTKTKRVVIDPIGININFATNTYFDYLNQLGKSFEACFSH